jgi:very-short-patch-repair endonuclease
MKRGRKSFQTNRDKFAYMMRCRPTSAEKLLYSALKAVRHDYTSKGTLILVVCSQVILGPYIVDILLPKQRVVIEVDGPSHNTTRAYDAKRTEYLSGRNYRVFRISNEEVWIDLSAVVEKIMTFAKCYPKHSLALAVAMATQRLRSSDGL